MHLRILHRDMIILNTAEAAIDLFDKRSANYSDRPGFPILKLCVSPILYATPLPEKPWLNLTGWVGSQPSHS